MCRSGLFMPGHAGPTESAGVLDYLQLKLLADSMSPVPL